jgi:hypothetical protein
MTPCSLEVGYQCFEGICFPVFTEILVTTSRTTGRTQCKNMKFWEELIFYFHLIRHGPCRKDASNNSSIVECVFVAAITFLPSRYQATIGDTYTDTDWWEGFMKYDFKKGIYIQSFIKIGSGIQKVDKKRAHRCTQNGDLINLYLFIYFFKIKKVGW